uniref:Uncharacterized protein n=1 Tax=Leersia perrieri TaxID=77586 RepID=A0A0D9UXX4_9ORYZ
MASPPHPLAHAAPVLLLLAILLLAVAAAVFLGLRGRRQREARLPLPEPAAAAEEEISEEGGREKGRRRKARRRQRKGGGGGEGDDAAQQQLLRQRPHFPLASVAGSLQRRINARYDDLAARASQAQPITIHQIHEFIKCLVDARNELQHKSETVERRCRIKKALLSNPYYSRKGNSDRLCEQVHKLEAEHKRLKKDADIYNYLQEEIQKSEPYKMLVEFSVQMEAYEHAPGCPAREMTFEELLAEEKKDPAFWQRVKNQTSTSSK